ncbi:MAG: hypothetical protein ABJB16_19300 [Saprospiraceae bacterium]
MKSKFLLLFLVCATIQAFGQRKFSAALEISAGISESTQPGFSFIPHKGVQFGRNAFLKGGYNLTDKLDFTLGVGYMNINAVEYVFFASTDVDFTQTQISHRYLVIPAGFKYHFGSFYLNPEIGIAISQRHFINQTSFFIENHTSQTSGFGGASSDFGFNKITLPLILNLGTEFDVKPVKILFGIKAYYSLDKMSEILTFSRHYYGVGVMTGVKF